MAYHDLTEDQRQFLYTHLTELQHTVVRARLDGHTWQRIATAMRIDEATVRGHWRRAQNNLTKAMEALDEQTTAPLHRHSNRT